MNGGSFFIRSYKGSLNVSVARASGVGSFRSVAVRSSYSASASAGPSGQHGRCDPRLYVEGRADSAGSALAGQMKLAETLAGKLISESVLLPR